MKGFSREEGAEIVAERRRHVCTCNHLQLVHKDDKGECLVSTCRCTQYLEREPAE